METSPNKTDSKSSRRTFLRNVGIASGALVAAPLLQACTPAPPAAATQAPSSGAKPAAKVGVTGKLVVIQMQDWHPDHNKLVRDTIQKYCDGKSWPLDISYTEGFSPGGNIISKLTASVQAGDPPDLMFHSDALTYQMKFLDLLVDMDDVSKDMVTKWGKPYTFCEKQYLIDGKWWETPFFARVGQYWIREDLFKAAGLDVDKDAATYEGLRDSCVKVSDPAKEMWGWGMTINRCGDGDSLVLNALTMWGGQLCDETGEYVTLNSPETVEGIRWITDIYMNPKWAKMLPPGVGGWTDPSNNEAFLAGKVAVTQNAGTVYAKAKTDKLPFADKIIWSPTPKGAKRQMSDGAACGFWCFKGSKNVAASKELISALLSEEIMKPLFKMSPGYVAPGFQKMWDFDEVKADRNTMRWGKVVFPDPNPYAAYAWPSLPTAALQAVRGANVLTDMAGAVLSGTKVEDAVKRAHDQTVQIYKEFKMKAVKS
jgi:multiple sugar transport system substrate-binding protein